MVTICSEKERKQFYDLIEANLASDKCRVIISVRSDFEAQFKDVPLLGAALENKFTVPPFQRDEIEAIIVQPAVQSLLEIKSIEKTEKCDSIFVDGIVDEVMQSPGGLPLLSFALEAWYVRSVKENDNQRILGESDYKKIGGVNGALSTITEKFSAKLNDTEKRYLKRLLLRMVKAEDGSYARRKVYEDEIDFEGRAANARSTQQLLEELIALRVITTNIDDENRQSGERVFYEPAHDSLLTTWKQLTEWIDKEGLGKMMVYRQLANTTDKWINSEKKKNILWDGGSDLDVIRNEFEQPGKSKTDWEKIIHWFKTRYTLGPRMIEADTHIFNKNEKAFIKASVRKTRVGSMVFNWALTIVVILLGVSVYMGVNVYRQSIRNRALYLSSESDKYGDVEKITLLKAAWNIQSDSSISDKIYNYISSHEYSDPLPIANFNTGTIFDSIYFKNDSTITFHNNAGREKDWSLPASAVTKDTTLDLKPTVVADDSKSIIKITTSFGGKNVVKKITNRKLLDYAVADENIAMISASPDYDYFIDFIGKNGENSIAIDDNHIEPVFLSGKKFIAYRKNYKGVVSDLSGHIIDSSTWEYHNVKHIYRSGGNTYELYSIFLSGEGSAGKMTLWYNDLKTRKTIAKTVFSDDSYFLEPQVDILQTNDSTCILAFRYQGNEGSDRSNGQSTRIRRWNLNSNKLVPIYDESKYYDRLEFVNDTTVFFSDAELWHVVVSLNSGEIDSLKLHPIKIRPENHGKYYYFVEKTALGFTSHLYDHKLRKIFSSEYSQAPVSEAISADNKFISIGFGDKNIYVWQLSNYFDPKPDGGALSDGPSANNFEIEEYDIDNDGSVIRISGHVNSGSGGLGVNYHSDPSIDHFNIDSFFKNYKNPYPYMRFEDIGTADKDLKKQVQEFNEAVEKKFAMSKAIRRSAYHYKDRSVYFIDSKIIIATPPGKLEVVKEESSPIVTGRLFDFGNKIMYVLQNGEIHFFRPKTDFKEFINKIDITLPAALRRRYKIN